MFEIFLPGMENMEKKWQVAEKFNNDFTDQFPEMNQIVLQLLYNRGLKSQDEIDKFLGPDYNKDQHDPYLFNEMEKAVRRIYQALEEKEKIVIYGDYDADGVSSTALGLLPDRSHRRANTANLPRHRGQREVSLPRNHQGGDGQRLCHRCRARSAHGLEGRSASHRDR